MTRDAASLSNMRDLAELGPVSWWPLAIGWWFVLGLIAVGTIFLALRTWRKWRDNAYRRAALKELRSTRDVVEVAQILKRTALCAYPRSKIASLSGEAWCDWLGETGSQEVSDSIFKCLTSEFFGEQSSGSSEELAVFAEHWIRHHQEFRPTNSKTKDPLQNDLGRGHATPTESSLC